MGNVNLNSGFSDADTLDGVHLSSVYAERGVISDCNDAFLPGTYAISSPYTNAPVPHYGLLTVHKFSGGWLMQEFKRTDIDNRKWFRQNINNTGWSNWTEFSSDGMYRNLEDNPTFVINQRLKTEYVSNGGRTVFCADRWHIYGGSGLDDGATVTAYTYTNGGLGIIKSCTSGYWCLCQTIEPGIYNTYLYGRAVSVHISTDCGVISGSLVVPDISAESRDLRCGDVNFDIYHGTFRIFSTRQGLNIYNVQIELGDHAINTQHIPDLTLELIKCKRYYQRICVFRVPVYFYTKSTNEAYYMVNFQPMRTNPTITMLAIPYIDTANIARPTIECAPVWANMEGVMKIRVGFDVDVSSYICGDLCLSANDVNQGFELSADI